MECKDISLLHGQVKSWSYQILGLLFQVLVIIRINDDAFWRYI